MELLKTIVIFVIFLLLSLLLGISRLYIIWLFYGIKNLFIKIKNFYKLYFVLDIKNKKEINFVELLSREYNSEIAHNDAIYYLDLFPHDINNDIKLYLISPHWWDINSYDVTMEYFTIYDVLNIFIYELDWRLSTYLKFYFYFNFNLDLSDDQILFFIKHNNLGCDLNKFKIKYLEMQLEGHFNKNLLDKSNKFWFFNYLIGPEKGRYII